jgi:hypothetical protein
VRAQEHSRLSGCAAAPSIASDVGPLFGPRAALKDAAKSARSVEHESASLGQELWRLVRELAAEPPPESRPVVGNGRFRAEHVLDLGDRPGVIDWDGFRRGARLAKFRRYEPAGRSARLS